jgi:hypothetical protein
MYDIHYPSLILSVTYIYKEPCTLLSADARRGGAGGRGRNENLPRTLEEPTTATNSEADLGL